MQLKSVQAFIATVETGSLQAAAQQLATVQSNMTAHIKKLEQELGVQLFQRQPRLLLTPAGQQFLGAAYRLVEAHQQAKYSVTDQAIGGVLRLGSMETTLACRLPPLLQRFQQAYPEVDLQLSSAPSALLMQQLAEGQLDGVFVAGAQPQGGWSQLPVWQEELQLISDHALTSLPDAAQLSQTRFFAFRQGCTYRHLIDRFFAHQGAYAPRITELGSIDAILGCVAAGLGWALLPQAVLTQRPLEGIHRLPLPAALGQMTTYWVTHTDEQHSPQLRAWQQFFSQQVAGHKGSHPEGRPERR